MSINPFWDLKNCTKDIIQQYGDAPNPGLLPPHIFSVARRAVDNMNTTGINQTILVSGESGAGKTEATKHIMRYFASAPGEVEVGGKRKVSLTDFALQRDPAYKHRANPCSYTPTACRCLP